MSTDDVINQAQVSAIEGVLVQIHNSAAEYTFASVAAEARRRHANLLAPLSDPDLCAAVAAIWDGQIKHLAATRAAKQTATALANMRKGPLH